MSVNNFEKNRLFRISVLSAAVLCGLVILSACASTQMDRLMPQIQNMVMARHYFGEPVASTELNDGTMRHEWVIDRETTIPGQYVTKLERWWALDRDGFPRYEERTYWVPAHTEHHTCRLTVIAEKDGQVISSKWEGNNCDQLPLVKPTY